MLVRRRSVPLQIGPYYIILLACGYGLLKLTQVIGMHFPSRLLVAYRADLHSDAVDRAVIGPPNCAEDQRVIRWLLPLRLKVGAICEATGKNNKENSVQN